MDKTFDVDRFITRIGSRLVEQFEEARRATSPSTVGAAMEQPVRRQLEQVLPRGIAVGSGFVIDSYGGTSSQTDVVLYERDICPVFSINDTPETTYYPCEGVIAVGQIKSILTKQHLEEEFRRIASVKQLCRYPVYEFMPNPTTGEPVIAERSYGSVHTPSIVHLGGRENIELRQILGFILAGTSQMQDNILMEKFRYFTGEISDRFSPNIAVILDGGLLSWGNITNRRFETIKPDKDKTYGVRETFDGPDQWERVWSARNASQLSYSSTTDSFRELVRLLHEIYRTGRTVDVRAFDQYFISQNNGSSYTHTLMPK